MAFHMREATEADIPSLCDVFFDAFSEDPISSRVFPRSSAHAQAEIQDTFTHSVAEPDVHIFVVTEEPASDSAVDQKNAILGYVEWVAPRSEPYSPPPPAPSTDGKKAEALAQQFFEVMERKQREHMANQPHWHLAFIGVRHRAQGRGVARQLIQWGIEKADEEGMEAYVQSSPMAASRYRRYGFEDIETHHFDLAGDYHEVFMKRMPQQKQPRLPSSKEPKAIPEEAPTGTDSLKTSQLFSTLGSAREGKSLNRFDHSLNAIAQVG
ncbi:hypothetical protein PG989_012725 [Apiospora arundinis]